MNRHNWPHKHSYSSHIQVVCVDCGIWSTLIWKGNIVESSACETHSHIITIEMQSNLIWFTHYTYTKIPSENSVRVRPRRVSHCSFFFLSVKRRSPIKIDLKRDQITVTAHVVHCLVVDTTKAKWISRNELVVARLKRFSDFSENKTTQFWYNRINEEKIIKPTTVVRD